MRTDGVRLAVLQHEPETGLGAFAGLLDEFGVEYAVVRTGHGPLPDASSFEGAIALGGSSGLVQYSPSFTYGWLQSAAWRITDSRQASCIASAYCAGADRPY